MGAKVTILLIGLLVAMTPRLPAQGELDATRAEASKLTKQDIPELVRKAEAGDIKAQVLLGEAYRFGYGVRGKDSEAVKWYRKAAEQGNAVAQLALSIAYQFGRGVRKDLEEAKAWCHKAAEQGLVEAELNLGAIYNREKNYADGATWTRKAAEHGNFYAQGNLADSYAGGLGVPQDHLSAYMWVLLARTARCGEPPVICVTKDPVMDADTQRFRDEERAKLSPEQVAEARRRASEWLIAHQKEPLPAEETEVKAAHFLVSHQHAKAAYLAPGRPGMRPDYCFGPLTITQGMIRYVSRRGNDAFEIPIAQLKEVRKLSSFGRGDFGIIIRVEGGKNYTLFVINEGFEEQDPHALFEALNREMGRK